MKILIFSFFTLLTSLPLLARPPLSGNRFEHLSGVRLSGLRGASVEDISTQLRSRDNASLSTFLVENHDYISEGAEILEIGITDGKSAVFLARKGHKVTAIDQSSVAVRRLQELAREFDVRVNTYVSSIDDFEVEADSFDVIVSFHGQSPSLSPLFQKWLRPEGLLFFEAFTSRQQSRMPEGLQSEYYFLPAGQLPDLFGQMTLLKYQEPLHLNEFKASAIFKNQ